MLPSQDSALVCSFGSSGSTGTHAFTNSSLSLNFVDANLGVLLLMMWNGEVVSIQFRNKNPSLGAKTARHLGQQAVVVSILLFEDVYCAVSGEIQALVLRIITHVVDHAHGIQ